MTGPAPAAPSPWAHDGGFSLAMSQLRGCLTLLVVIFHAFLAYYPGPFPFTITVLRMSFPVLDPKRFAGARDVSAFNDIFFMSAFFFVSGMFMWPSLAKKRPAAFLEGRLLRLGVPFLFASGLVAAIAYYPTYLQSLPAHPSVADYASTWLTLSQWRSGAAWFIAILLLFDALAAAAFLADPRWGERVAKLAAGSAEKPLRFFGIVLAVSIAAYVPMALIFTPYTWWNIGPFWLQKSRALQYAAYFVLGAGMGAYGVNRGLVSPGGALAKRWAWWTAAMVLVFVGVGNGLWKAEELHLERHPLWGPLADAGWALDCALTSFAFMAIFARFARPNRFWDSLARNAYGIYLVHYAIVSWAQYALLDAPVSGQVKALVVTMVSIGLSWMVAAAIRRIPGVARVV